MTATLTILHRIDRPFDEINHYFTPIGDLRFAEAYTVAVPISAESKQPVDIAECAFAACGNAPYPIAGWEAVQDVHMRARRRSLSVGDIVLLDLDGPTLGTRQRVAFTVQNAGWKRVPVGLTEGRFVTDYPLTY